MKIWKKALALMLVISMMAGVGIQAFAAVDDTGFSDVPANAWYAEAVEYCRENGLMSGTSATRFEPNGTMTRAMLVTALYRQTGQPAVTGTDNFTDTAEGTWYSDAVLWASQQGIVGGYGNGLFGVKDPVSREQMVTILWRMAGSPATEVGEAFADQGSISRYAVTAVAWARANGIVNGKGGNRFDPKGSATRAEVAVVLTNQAKAVASIPDPTPTPSPSTPPIGSSSGNGGGNSGGGGSTTPSTPTPTPTPTPAPTPTPTPAPTPTPTPTPTPAFTESLTFVKEGDAYTVTGVGDETTVVIPGEYEGLPVAKIQGNSGTGAFAQKTFTSVTIPDSVIEIGQNTFYGCKELTEVKLGENSKLTTIGNNAFSACSALKSVTIPKGVTTIGDSAFNNCSSLEGFDVADGNTVFHSENGHLIETATRTLIRGANHSMIPEGVKSLEVRSFQRANGITELNIPKSVTKIGSYFINESTITKINYAGTQAEWDQIEMSSMWNYGNRDVQVVCAEEPAVPSGPKILIAYFSATNNTESIANHIKTTLGDDADVYEILAETPYTSADLNYNTDCRANREQNDANARPAIFGSVDNMAQYDVIFLGYPIWWGQAPKIMYTFVESYDLSGKTIVPFCTSGSSGIGSSATNLAGSASSATWLNGQRFSGGASQSTVETWVNGLGLTLTPAA